MFSFFLTKFDEELMLIGQVKFLFFHWTKTVISLLPFRCVNFIFVTNNIDNFW